MADLPLPPIEDVWDQYNATPLDWDETLQRLLQECPPSGFRHLWKSNCRYATRGLVESLKGRYDQVMLRTCRALIMLPILKHLLLIFTCLPMIVGCCWHVRSGLPGCDETSPRIGWRLNIVDVWLGRFASRDGSQDQDVEHCCLEGVASRSGGPIADRLGGVQMGNISSVVPCSRTTRPVACDMPELSRFRSLRSHLAKQVLLI